MGGIFGVVAQENCVQTLFYGTDYHSHLGTENGGMAVSGATGFQNAIHSISQTQFKARFLTTTRKWMDASESGRSMIKRRNL